MTTLNSTPTFLIEFKILFNRMSKLFSVSIMHCKSLCLSLSKTNIVSTLVPTVQGSTIMVVSCCVLRSFLFCFVLFFIIIIFAYLLIFFRANSFHFNIFAPFRCLLFCYVYRTLSFPFNILSRHFIAYY